jgi:hypothetical protein
MTVCTLIPKPPERMGMQRKHWYLYDVVHEGETIVSGSHDPECAAARVLQAKGITGKFTMLDSKTGEPRTIINIEKAAKLTVRDDRLGMGFVKYHPMPENAYQRPEGPAPAAGSPSPVQSTPEPLNPPVRAQEAQ